MTGLQLLLCLGTGCGVILQGVYFAMSVWGPREQRILGMGVAALAGPILLVALLQLLILACWDPPDRPRWLRRLMLLVSGCAIILQGQLFLLG